MLNSHARTTLNFIHERRNISKTIALDGQSLSIPKVFAISLSPKLQITVAEGVIDVVDENEAYLIKELECGLVIYGINTGFGGSAGVRSWKCKDIQKALIRSENAGMGRIFPSNITRAAMLIRANCLLKGYSGVRPIVPKTLIDMINNDIVPHVPIRGSVSASGDLIPLGYIAAAMTGREDLKVTKGGEEMSCPDALKEAGITHLVMGPKEGLALTNAATFAAALAAITVYDANVILLLAQVCTGLTVEALHGRTESFHPLIHDLLPHIGQREIAHNMLAILDESKLAINKLDMYLPDHYGVLKQDRYSMRCSPQWLGPCAETLTEACRRITVELNSVSDNPIVDHRTDTIVHGGNFQAETLSITMDQTRQALGVCGKLLFAQFSELVNDKLNFGLPPNLSGCNINLDFGFKGCDLAMASYMSELDYLANPMSNHVLSAETHNQSVNSLALVSARRTAEALEIAQMMIANLLCLCLQAVELRMLRNEVQQEIETLKQKHPTLSHALNDILWYDLLFLSEKTIHDFLCSQPADGLFAKKNRIIKRMTKLYESAITGCIDTSQYMGQGTRKMHNYIRKGLSVPFYHGQAYIDTWLNRILVAIQNREIETVIDDIFTPALIQQATSPENLD